MTTPDRPSLAGAVPFSFKLAVIWQQFKNFSRYLRFYWKSLSPATATPQGFKFYGNRHMLAGTFEPEETRLVARMLNQTDVFINVGANIGYYCCIALSHGKHVVAFEPIDLNVRHLLTNVRINGWQNQIEIYPLALGSELGILELFGAGTGASFLRGWANNPDHHVSLAPVSTLDTMVGDRFAGKRCLILVDIEGAEHIMLSGAGRILAASPKPSWLVEISIDHHRPGADRINAKFQDTFALFWDHGYEAWTVGAQPRKIDPAEVKMVAQTGNNTFSNNNFIFLSPGSAPDLLGV